MENREKPQAAGLSGLNLERLVLASASPRRAEILRAVDWPFEAIAADLDERLLPGESAQVAVRRLALEKARAVADRCSNALVLGADTTVVVDSEILGKPEDDDDARRMLAALAGRWHEVLTGVAILRSERKDYPAVGHEVTRVRFAEMSEAEIDWYVSTGEPKDKAGAYAVQGRGALFIEEIAGDYWNVVGLPIRLVYELMKSVRPASEFV